MGLRQSTIRCGAPTTLRLLGRIVGQQMKTRPIDGYHRNLTVKSLTVAVASR